MRLNAISYYADVVIGLILVVVMIAFMRTEPWRVDFEWLSLLVLGIAVWTLAEYLIHRWIYHHVPYFERMHQAHHNEPKAFIGAPPLLGIAIILCLFYVPFASISPVVASGLSVGVLLGYCAYQLVHHAAHHGTPFPSMWLDRARRHHALHHFQSDQVNFGITTTVWDRVFGTTAKSTYRRAA